MADKTVTMKIAEFSTNLVDLVNNSGLPPCITLPIIRNVQNEVEKANDKILAEDIANYQSQEKEIYEDGKEETE